MAEDASYKIQDTVLSATFDPDTHEFYFLTLKVALSGKNGLKIGKASLESVNTVTNVHRKLASFPYASNNHVAVFLNRLEGGELALAVTTEANHQIFRFRVAGSSATVVGHYAAAGRIVSHPVLGERDLALLVRHNGKYSVKSVDKYGRGKACTL